MRCEMSAESFELIKGLEIAVSTLTRLKQHDLTHPIHLLPPNAVSHKTRYLPPAYITITQNSHHLSKIHSNPAACRPPAIDRGHR